MKFSTGFLVLAFNFFDALGDIHAQHFADAAVLLHTWINVGGGGEKVGGQKKGGECTHATNNDSKKSSYRSL